MNWVNEWLLFNANSALFQLYHGEDNFNFQWHDDGVRSALDQHALLDFYSARSLKQQFADVGRLWHIILIPSQPVFTRSP